MKHWVSFFLFFLAFFANAQDKFSKEFRFITDNDLYVSINKDRYYTSGIFLEYSFLKKHNNPKLSKKIIDLSLNQKIYTPINPTLVSKGNHDRPFAGYLYGKFGVKNAYKNKSILGFSVEMGTLGKKSYAKELQKFIHSFYNFAEITGWDYQIRDAFAINFNLNYSTNLYTSKNKMFDFGWISNANAGTMFTDISSGFYTRFGIKELQKIINSSGFNSNLNNASTNLFNKTESFFFLKPSLRWAFYDATLQGSFLNTTSPITKVLNPFVLDVEIGFRYVKKSFNFGYSIHWYSNKSKGLKTDEINRYGTIFLGYLFN